MYSFKGENIWLKLKKNIPLFDDYFQLELLIYFLFTTAASTAWVQPMPCWW